MHTTTVTKLTDTVPEYARSLSQELIIRWNDMTKQQKNKVLIAHIITQIQDDNDIYGNQTASMLRCALDIVLRQNEMVQVATPHATQLTTVSERELQQQISRLGQSGLMFGQQGQETRWDGSYSYISTHETRKPTKHRISDPTYRTRHLCTMVTKGCGGTNRSNCCRAPNVHRIIPYKCTTPTSDSP